MWTEDGSGAKRFFEGRGLPKGKTRGAPAGDILSPILSVSFSCRAGEKLMTPQPVRLLPLLFFCVIRLLPPSFWWFPCRGSGDEQAAFLKRPVLFRVKRAGLSVRA